MSFAHSGSHLQALEPVCLSEVAQEAIGLLSLNRRSVEVEFFNLCDPAHWVEGDSQRLAQVLINLLSNARDASPPGGAIRVRSEASEHTVDLVVEDEGSGIPKAIMDQLFEPFFTTKGKGFGLGLFLSQASVTRAGGTVKLYNHEDGGTLTELRLPRSYGMA
ncbi:hypothetical protein OUHCRE3_53470 [Enterobacter hormaechei]